MFTKVNELELNLSKVNSIKGLRGFQIVHH